MTEPTLTPEQEKRFDEKFYSIQPVDSKSAVIYGKNGSIHTDKEYNQLGAVKQHLAQEIARAKEEGARENDYLMAEVGGFLAGIAGELDDMRKEIAKNYAKRLGVVLTTPPVKEQ